ncbi:class I SAM-dependent methyltransferase [Paenibacillus hodogayensis]|uniref:Class I SAM-dependent methyltransferase n=1 Tax=Paenibacillus hodogayensis TaxID=279208 RepID=A0ABV5W4A3_9BACL
MALDSHLLFLKKFIQNPKQIGSIVPSSPFLANEMVRSVPWSEISALAELGSGTGSITRFIQANATRSAKVFLFEKDERMLSDLLEKYPAFLSYPNARELTEIIRMNGVHHLDCVISGLPFFNFSEELRDKLMSQITEALRPGGYFIAFQYTLQMKKHLERLFDVERIRFVPMNVPPAFVYICRKRARHE